MACLSDIELICSSVTRYILLFDLKRLKGWGEFKMIKFNWYNKWCDKLILVFINI